MRFPRGIRGEFRAHCINFLRNGKREPHRSRAVRGQKWGNGGATGRTNKHYNPKNRHERKESDRFKSFTHEDLTKRGKLNLDIFWLKDESLEDSANLPLHCHPEFPASLDTLKVSVPPAVKLAAASANLDDFVNCYLGGKH